MISVTETEATCRLPPAADRAAGSYDVVAFASTYEESNCAVAGGCQFTFAAPAPAVTAAAAAFYPEQGDNGEYHINIEGTGFPTETTGIEVELAGTAQTVVSASATQIVVRVDSLTSGLTASAVDLYLPGDYPGTPSGGAAGLPAAIEVVFVPQLVSLSTGTVSAAGSVITAAVWGVGPDDEVTLWD